MQRKYLLEKCTLRNLNSKKLKAQLRSIKDEGSKNASYGVETVLKGRLKPVPFGDPGEEQLRYSVQLIVTKQSFVSEDQANSVLDTVEKLIKKEAERQKWHLVGEASDVITTQVRPPFEVPVLDEVSIATNFSGLFSREPHLRVIHSATEMYSKTNGDRRSHTCLFGQPGAAKTVMFEMLKRFYEVNSPVPRVKILDGTSITSAGLENYLLDLAEANELPEIIVLEEIEKKDLRDVFCLGALMDGRGVIQKLNARVNRRQVVKTLVWCTCNDESYLKEFHKGYLWSRFTHKLECVRPSRSEAYEILLYEINKIPNGKIAWAQPALDFAWDTLKSDDIRECIGLLDGQDRLLSGEYQADRLAILNAAKAHRAELAATMKVEAGRDVYE